MVRFPSGPPSWQPDAVAVYWEGALPPGHPAFTAVNLLDASAE